MSSAAVTLTFSPRIPFKNLWAAVPQMPTCSPPLRFPLTLASWRGPLLYFGEAAGGSSPREAPEGMPLLWFLPGCPPLSSCPTPTVHPQPRVSSGPRHCGQWVSKRNRTGQNTMAFLSAPHSSSPSGGCEEGGQERRRPSWARE